MKILLADLDYKYKEYNNGKSVLDSFVKVAFGCTGDANSINIEFWVWQITGLMLGQTWCKAKDESWNVQEGTRQ